MQTSDTKRGSEFERNSADQVVFLGVLVFFQILKTNISNTVI